MNYVETTTPFFEEGDSVFFANKEGVIKLAIIVKTNYDCGCIFTPFKKYLYFFDKDIPISNTDQMNVDYILTDDCTMANNFYDILNDKTDRIEKCPEEGSFIAYKKVLFEKNTPGIAVLEIPEDARRLTGNELLLLLNKPNSVNSMEYYPAYKCRAEKVKVIRFETIEGVDLSHFIDHAFSIYNNEFVYKMGETITADSFDPNPEFTCSHGIHFFMNREDAVNY